VKQAERDLWTKYAESIGGLRNDPIIAQRPEYAGMLDTPKSSKYGNVRVQVDGRWFDSKREAARWQELKFRHQAGEIDELETQPQFPLHIMELYRSQAPIVVKTVATYIADFRYRDLRTGEIIVEDVKSPATREKKVYRLKRKIAEAVHGVHIREVE
jgi:hypothetical protein